MSNHAVEVVPVSLSPHPNADSLSIARVWGYQVVVRTEDWQDRPLGAYIPPDSIVPATEQFAFLGDNRRIRAKKLRGVWSQGMLVPAPDGAGVGDDVADILGITHYEPPLRLPRAGGSDPASPPPGLHPKYDVENMRRYAHLFVPGEPVIATEKIHGANGRWCWAGGEFHCGSRNQWVKDEPGSIWWKALRQNAGLMEFLRDHPFVTAYGEVYGAVQSLRYGHGNGDVSLALFDLWFRGSAELIALFGEPFFQRWCSDDYLNMMARAYDLPLVPLVYRGPFDLAALEQMAEGPSLIDGANHHREGIVVKPVVERDDPEIGRVQLKIVSNTYLEKAA